MCEQSLIYLFVSHYHNTLSSLMFNSNTMFLYLSYKFFFVPFSTQLFFIGVGRYKKLLATLYISPPHSSSNL